MKTLNSFKTIALLLLALCFYNGNANNIQITNVRVEPGFSASGRFVVFDVSWENSWKNTITNNHDAAWIFIKVNYNGAWQHLDINTTNIHSSFNFDIPADRKGFFISRKAPGSGNVTLNVGAHVTLPPITGDIEIRVFGIEMVYIPQASFMVGDMYSDGTFTPAWINTGNATATPYVENDTIKAGYPYGGSAPTTSEWPNGYRPFYCMKYEISQEQYAEFLNTLSRTQQRRHVKSAIIMNSETNRFVMSGTPMRYLFGRNGIRCDANLISPELPVRFYCDYDSDGNPNEPNDGQCIAANYLQWSDVLAYLDWSGLRPMTEAEFEKVCRGPLPVVPGEYAWGSTVVRTATGVINAATNAEVVNNVDANHTELGPVRVGNYARPGSGRLNAGAAYYGVLDMTGNLEDGVVCLGSIHGQAFRGTHGDGSLAPNGDANVSDWPSLCIYKGGSFRGVVPRAVSNRSSFYIQTTPDVTRDDADISRGGRGARSAY